jgi:hypothetical protein
MSTKELAQNITNGDVAVAADVKCSKEGCTEVRHGGRAWCKAHWAEYMRFYRVSGLERAASQGFARGVQAMRELLVGKFAAIRGTGGFSPMEIAGMIQECEGPVQEVEV